MVFKYMLIAILFSFSILILGENQNEEVQIEIVSVQRRLTTKQMIQEGRDLSLENHILGNSNIGEEFILNLISRFLSFFLH